MSPQNDTYNEVREKPYESYTSYVAARTQRNPCLRSLLDFLTSDHSLQRACQIAYVEFSSPSGVAIRKRLDLNTLASLLVDKTKGIRGQLLIVEDLSPAVIETLGSALNLDPFFFASHIDVARNDMRVKRPCTATLPSMIRSRDFLTLHYHRVLEFEHLPPRSRLRRDMNVPRKVMILPSIQGTNIGLARHCCSISKTVGHDGLWLGIVLVDVSINDSFLIEGDRDSLTTVKLQVRPFQGGYENLDCGTSFIESRLSESGAEGRSLLEDLIFYWGNREPPGFDVNRPTLVSLSYLPLKVVAAEWMMYLEVMFHSTKQHEYPPNSIPAASRQISLLNTDLSTLQAWARRSMATSSKIHDVIRLLEHQRSQDHDIQCCTLLIEDYEYIASRVDRYSHRLEAMVPTVTSLIQIFDSQQSLKETANIARLTYLALVFMPLTFVSGLLSMNDRIVSGSQIFWLYLAMAIPVCTMVFFVARPPRRILDFLSMWTWKRSRPSDEVSAKEETNKP